MPSLSHLREQWSRGAADLKRAVSVSMLASGVATCAVVTLILIGAASEGPPHEVLLLGPLLQLCALVPAAILLVIPATIGYLAVFVSAMVVCGSRW